MDSTKAQIGTTEDGTTMGFLIRMTPEQVEKARESLTQVGVEFDPENQMAMGNGDSDIDQFATGDDIPIILEKLNDALEEGGSEMRFPESAEGMSLEERHQVMELGHFNIVWNGKRPVEDDKLREDGGVPFIIENGYKDLKKHLRPVNRRSRN